MGVRRWILGASLAFAVSNAVADVVLRSAPWPAARACTGCVKLQFGSLEMQLPQAEVSKILVVPRGPFTLLVRGNGDIPNSPTLHDLDQSSTLSRYAKTDILGRYNVKSARDFYELMGKPSAGDRALAKAKEAELIASASAYTTTSKGPVHVYRIESAEPDAQRMYLLVDGDESLYMVTGPISQRLYEAMLANLRVVKMP